MITILAGGGGGAKLATGLAQSIPAEQLVVIANTGDDFKQYGLHVSPDLDSILYNLAGRADVSRGWGLQEDTFHCLENLHELGEEVWFKIGDRDLAMHLARTMRLSHDQTLSEVTRQVSAALGVQSRVLPMTDSYVPTFVHTRQGEMHLQEYFVRYHYEPEVLGLHYENIKRARPARGALNSLWDAEAIILAPSNPFISIGPILELPGVRQALRKSKAPVAAISPIIEGRALKGPTAKMLLELGHEVSAVGVARIYQDISTLFILDYRDASLRDRIADLGFKVFITDTLMSSNEDRQRVAQNILGILRQ